MHEETCFVECSCYGKQAETLNQYMSKGRGLLVEGRLRYEQWTAKDGAKRSKLKVVVDRFQFLDGGGGRRSEDSSAQEGQSYPAPESAAPAPAAPSPAADLQESGPPAPADSEIPF